MACPAASGCVERVATAARRGHRGHPGVARRPPVLHAPHGRAGARRAAHRRPGRHRAGARRPDRDRRVRQRPPWTRGSRPRRATCSPTSSPPAAPRSRCCTSSTSRPATASTGPIDRARYSPVAWLPGGEAFYYVRRLRAELVPADEAQYHRRVWLHRVGTDPDDGRRGVRRRAGHDQLLRRHRVDGRPVARRRRVGRHRAAQRPVAGRPVRRPRSTRRRCGSCRRASTPARRCTSAATAGSTCSPTATRPRGRLAVTTPTTRRTRRWTDLVPEDDEAVLEGYAILDGADRRRPPADGGTLLCAWTRHAVGEITVHDLLTGERTGAVPLPGLGSVTGLAERPEGGHEAWFGYTDHVDAGVGLPLRRAHRRDHAVGDRARARSTCPRCTPGRWSTPRPTAPRCGCSCSSPAKEPDRPRPTVLYGYGGFGIPMTPGYSAGLLAWVEAGGVYAIANLRGGVRGGRGVAPRRHAGAQAERVRRLPRGRRAARRRRLDDHRRSWPSPAAPTAGCWSARR